MLETRTVLTQLLEALDLAAYHEPLLHLLFDGQGLPKDILWDALPCGDVTVKLGQHTLCTMQVVRAGTTHGDTDPIISPTQQWDGQEEDLEFDHLQDANRAGFFHVVEYVCQDDAPPHTGKVLLLQQEGTFEWIRNANLDRLGSIPTFRTQDTSVHFFKANKDACQQLLGVHVVMAIQGAYDPVSPNKWALLAGGQELRWCKICRAPRTITPRQCNDLFHAQLGYMQR